ncbi:C39 family peptidase [Roseburia hominis]
MMDVQIRKKRRLPRQIRRKYRSLLLVKWLFLAGFTLIIVSLCSTVLRQRGHTISRNFTEIAAGSHSSAESTTAKHATKKIISNVPYINQTDSYPNGCESVTAVMALKYLNFPITVDEFINKYLDMGEAPHYASDGCRYGCDPWKQYPGDPRSENGWGCFAPVIANSLNAYLHGTSYTAITLEKIPLQDICTTYIEADQPVLIWATTDMRETSSGSSWIVPETEELFTWTKYLHCLLLVGYDDEYYYFHDPLRSAALAYDKGITETAYQAMGEQAIVICKTK